MNQTIQNDLQNNITEEELIAIINKAHNSNLVNPNKSPNDNFIYHLYSDGEITEQKGGWAYLQRSERTIEDRIYSIKYIDHLKFPLNRKICNKQFGYIICSREDSIKIRNLLKLYYTKNK